MRRVNRVAGPDHLVTADCPGIRETRGAISFYNHPGNREKSYDSFEAYRHITVRRLLKKMFEAKCCYCEAAFEHVAPADIEHYRPKGSYVDASGTTHRPGYYWLAFDWDNLLYSCIDCNRARRHEDDEGTSSLSGKASHFPLIDETLRARTPGAESAESPALLHPCEDDVESLLAFTDEGAVYPSTSSGSDFCRAETTIRILGLQRPGLAKRREDRMNIVIANVARYKDFLAESLIRPKDRFVGRVTKDCAEEIRALLNEEHEFSSMVRRYVLRTCAELF